MKELMFIIVLGTIIGGCSTMSESCRVDNLEDLNTVMHRVYNYEQMLGIGTLNKTEFVRNMKEEIRRWQDKQMAYDSCMKGKGYYW